MIPHFLLGFRGLTPSIGAGQDKAGKKPGAAGQQGPVGARGLGARLGQGGPAKRVKGKIKVRK